MEGKLSSLEYLNEVLKTIGYHRDSNHQITLPLLVNFFNNSHSEKTNLGDIRLILAKLSDDGYITISEINQSVCTITFKGMVFLEYGGYIQEGIDNKKRLSATETDENTRKANEKRMVILTGGLSDWTRRLTYATIVVGALLFLWDVVKFCIEHHFCH